jgi:CHAP domain
VLVVAALGIAALLLSGGAKAIEGGPALPSTPVRAKMVTLAESQVGYQTSPSNSYCNKFSAFWGAGTTTCGSGLRSEEWCADFAAWVWYKAGAQITYSFTTGVNAGAASFYYWAVAHGTWHPTGSGYTPQPGDVAVYGLDTTAGTASHVAVVTSYTQGAKGPDAVNGDGDQTGFSVVETRTDEYRADVPGQAGALSGYAAPIIPQPTASAGG